MTIQPWISYRGAETVSVKLCLSLNSLGHPSEIACLFLDKKRLPTGSSKIKYILPSKFWQKLLSNSKLAFYIFGAPLLTFLVVKNAKRFDVLNPHNPPSLWASQVAKIFSGKKIVWSFHNQFTLQSAILVDKIIAPTKKIAKLIKKTYGMESTVLYNAL